MFSSRNIRAKMSQDFRNSPNVYMYYDYDSSRLQSFLLLVLLGPGPRHPQDTVYITAFPAQFPLPRRVVSGRVGGGDPPLQACRDSAGTPRTRVRLEPAIDKTCRPRRLQSEMSGFDLCLPPKLGSHRRFQARGGGLVGCGVWSIVGPRRSMYSLNNRTQPLKLTVDGIFGKFFASPDLTQIFFFFYEIMSSL